MQSATRILSDQIRMLQELKKLSTKPHFMEAVKLIAQPNGVATAPTSVSVPVSRAPMWDTGITEAVIAAVAKLDGDFDYTDVARQLQQDGYKLQSSNARDSVGRVLRNMASRGGVRTARKGTGGKPTTYRR